MMVQDTNFSFFFFSVLFQDRSCAVISADPKLDIGKWYQKSCDDKNAYICLRNLGEDIP